MFPQNLLLKSAAKGQTNKQKTQHFLPPPCSVRSPSRIKLCWYIQMITLTDSLAESVNASVWCPSICLSQSRLAYTQSNSQEPADVLAQLSKSRYICLSVVQVSCQVYSYWQGQELASSILDSDSSYWVGIKYTSVINLLFVIWRRVQQCRS